MVAAAEEEGKVVLYTGLTPEAVEALSEAFEAQYPAIDVEIVRLGSADVAQRADAEQQAGAPGADALLTFAGAWHEARGQQAGFFAPLAGPAFGELDAGLLRGDTAAMAVGAPFAIGRNTDAVDQEIEDYPDLLDLANDVPIAALDFTLGDRSMDFYVYLEDLYGTEFLEGLAKKDLKYYASTVPIAEAVTSGEVGAALYIINSAVSANAPVEVTLAPSPNVQVGFVSVAGWASHPNAAQVFADFVMTEDAQEILATEGFATALDVPGALTIDDATVLDGNRFTEDFYAEFREHLREIFDR